MARLHPVFNMIKLLPVPDDPIPGRRSRPPPPPEIVGGEEHYIVEEILDSRLIHGQLHFLIKWDGHGYEENTWVPEHDVSAPNKIQEFYRDCQGTTPEVIIFLLSLHFIHIPDVHFLLFHFHSCMCVHVCPVASDCIAAILGKGSSPCSLWIPSPKVCPMS
jgi:hypothetical protein